MSALATPSSELRFRRVSGSPPSPKFAHLGYQNSLELAKRTIAENERRKYEELRARQKGEQVKQRRLQTERLMLQRQKEEDAKRSGEELGAQLLQSLRNEVIARIEVQVKEEVRLQAQADRQTWYSDFTNFEKGKISDQLREDLEPVIRSELSSSLLPEVQAELRTELTPEILAELKVQHSKSVEHEVREQLRQSLTASVIEQLRRENISLVRESLKEENRGDVVEELRKDNLEAVVHQLRQEQYDDVRASLREEMSSATGHEIAASPKRLVPAAVSEHVDPALPDIGQIIPEQEDHDHLSNGDSRKEPTHPDRIRLGDLYPDLSEKINSEITRVEDTASYVNDESADGSVVVSEIRMELSDSQQMDPSLAQSPESFVAKRDPGQDEVDHKTRNADTLEADVSSQPVSAGSRNDFAEDGLNDTNFETAPEQKDFRFNPDIHSLKFSSPVSEVRAGGKHSLDLSDGDPDESGPRSKRRRDEESELERDGSPIGEDGFSSRSMPQQVMLEHKQYQDEPFEHGDTSDDQRSIEHDDYDSEVEYSEVEDSSDGSDASEEEADDDASHVRRRQHLQNQRDIRQLLDGDEDGDEVGEGDVDEELEYASGSEEMSEVQNEDAYDSYESEEDAEAPVITYTNTQDDPIDLDDD